MTVRPLSPRSALAGVAVPGRYGRKDGDPGVTLSERVDLGLATIMTRRSRTAALRAAVETAYGVDLPESSRCVRGPAVAFIGTGPGQWLAVSERLANGALAADLGKALAGSASISDQSDGRAIVRIQGPHARDVLAKGLPVDLHPSVLPTGSAATSMISLMGVTLWQVDDDPTFDVALFRSLAGSFWKWLADSSAEFGFDVEPVADRG